MNTGENKNRVAQPADEEIKLHGDQLARQVKDAAGGQPDERSQNNQNNAPEDKKN